MYKKIVISLNITLLNVRLVFLFCAFVHLVVTAVVTLTIDTTVDDDPKVRAYHYTRWKLITCWFNLITLAYLPARLYVDWKMSHGEGSKVLVKQLEHASDVIMTGLLFPVVLFADGLFWLIYNNNPAFLGPPRIFEYLPDWTQHSLHTVSFVVMMLDLVLTPRERPKSLKPRFTLLMTFSVVYFLTLYYNYLKGEMVYPGMQFLSTVQLAIAALVSLAVGVLLFVVQWVAIDYIWGAKQTNISKIPLKKIS